MHLAHLSRVGLVSGERVNCFTHYSVNYATMHDLITILTINCRQDNIIACKQETWVPGS